MSETAIVPEWCEICERHHDGPPCVENLLWQYGPCRATYGTNLSCQLRTGHDGMHTNRHCGQDWFDDKRAESGLTHEQGLALLTLPPVVASVEPEAKRHKRIWLQAEEHEGDEVTWCQDKIHDSDVEYVLAPTEPVEDEEVKDWKYRLPDHTVWVPCSAKAAEWYGSNGYLVEPFPTKPEGGCTWPNCDCHLPEPVAIRQWRRVGILPEPSNKWYDHEGTDEQWQSWKQYDSFEQRTVYTHPAEPKGVREELIIKLRVERDSYFNQLVAARAALTSQPAATEEHPDET